MDRASGNLAGQAKRGGELLSETASQGAVYASVNRLAALLGTRNGRPKKKIPAPSDTGSPSRPERPATIGKLY
jgi:hypothetical protein